MAARRGALLAVMLLASLALTACSGDDAPAAAPSVTPSPTATATLTATATATASPSATTTTAPTSTLPAARSTGYFVAVVRNGIKELAKNPSDDYLSAVANRICDDLAAKKTGDDVVSTVEAAVKRGGVTVDQATARELIKAAIDSVCDDQAARVDEF